MVLFIACLSPSDESYDENFSTLTYAKRAMSIINVAKQAKPGESRGRSSQRQQQSRKIGGVAVTESQTELVVELIERNKALAKQLTELNKAIHAND